MALPKVLAPSLVKLGLTLVLSFVLLALDPCGATRVYLVGGGESMTYPCGFVSRLDTEMFYRAGRLAQLAYKAFVYAAVSYAVLCVATAIFHRVKKPGS